MENLFKDIIKFSVGLSVMILIIIILSGLGVIACNTTVLITNPGTCTGLDYPLLGFLFLFVLFVCLFAIIVFFILAWHLGNYLLNKI